MIKVQGKNQPPNAPNIDGPSNGKPNTEYTFTFVSTDPDGDAVMYNVDWGDGDPSGLSMVIQVQRYY
jgi:hypothetical protein